MPLVLQKLHNTAWSAYEGQLKCPLNVKHLHYACLSNVAFGELEM